MVPRSVEAPYARPTKMLHVRQKTEISANLTPVTLTNLAASMSQVALSTVHNLPHVKGKQVKGLVEVDTCNDMS